MAASSSPIVSAPQVGPSTAAALNGANQGPGQPITPGPALSDTQVNIGTRDNPNIQNTAPQNSLVVTSNPADMEFANHSNDLNNILMQKLQTQYNNAPDPNSAGFQQSDPFLQQLNSISAGSDAATKSLISSIQASRQNQQNTTNTQYQNYISGMKLLGVQQNEAQATPDLLNGHIQQAESQYQQKLQDIDTETNKSLIDAQKAQQTGDLDTLKQKMDYINTLNTQKTDLLKEMSSIYSDNSTKYQSGATFFAPQILSELAGKTSAQKEAIILGVSQKTGIPAQYLAAATATAQQKATKSTAKGTTAGLKSIVTNVNSILNNTDKNDQGYSIRGDDGYVDPNAYLEAYQQFLKAGYSDKQWQANFPAKNYVNPQSYNLLPASLQPAKAKTANLLPASLQPAKAKTAGSSRGS